MNDDKSNADQAFLHEKRGMAYYERSDFDNAFRECQKAIDFNPKLADPYWIQGVIHSIKNENAEAKTLFEKVLELDTKHINAINSLGLLLIRDGRTREEGVQYLYQALELDPRFWKAHFNLGLANQLEGLNADALKQYARAFQLHPSVKTFESLAISWIVVYPKVFGSMLALLFLSAFIVRKPIGLLSTLILMIYFGFEIKYGLSVREYKKVISGSLIAIATLVLHIYVILFASS